MMFQSLLSLTALCASTQAFLVPFGGEPSAAHDLSLALSPHEVSVDCSSCPFALKAEQDGQREWSQDISSDLHIPFAIVDSDKLAINGVPVYPLAKADLPPVLTISQTAKNGKVDGQEVKLSYSLEIVSKPADDGNALLIVSFSPLALESEMIRVDDVEFKIIKDSEGRLLIHSVDVVTPSSIGEDAKCQNVMCRIVTKFLQSIVKAKQAAKAAAAKVQSHCGKCLKCMLRLIGIQGHHHPHGHGHGVGAPTVHPDGTVELPTHHKARPGHPGHPHGHHGHRHSGFFGRAMHLAWASLKVAFFPIMIGIAFGMAASALGMLMGQVVVFLWLRYRKNSGIVAYERLDEVDVKEEIPPPYEDVDSKNVEAINEKEVEDKA